ncbi:hypothetical protein BDP27DRAFT_1410251 [Rhodocollybia butyracea]|uniref:Uncharacterized protein n=1 Tax=Rhodocollybia butyracea TaxID=206335 RepID=A0A9P5P4F6_9AGAR|nr:hypothetical protein BDP27DRAFT_1410251 [Rhodocollybia butyracea]
MYIYEQYKTEPKSWHLVSLVLFTLRFKATWPSEPAQMLFKSTFINLVAAALAIAGPPMANLARQEPVTDLVTFCFSEGLCFEESINVDVGCVDLPEFNEPVETASLSSTGVECILSPEPSCLGGLGILLPTAGTVEISTLGISTVASYLCTSDVDVVNLCFPEITEGCFQATTVTNGCAGMTEFSIPFVSLLLTTNGTACTFFQDPDCTGPSAFVDEADVTFELDTLGIDNVKSLSCTNTQTPPPPRRASYIELN